MCSDGLLAFICSPNLGDLVKNVKNCNTGFLLYYTNDPLSGYLPLNFCVNVTDYLLSCTTIPLDHLEGKPCDVCQSELKLYPQCKNEKVEVQPAWIPSFNMQTNGICEWK